MTTGEDEADGTAEATYPADDALEDQVINGHRTSPYVIGLGGSAGGIEALQAFFEHMPTPTGMVFVVVLHLSPEHESLLPSILQRSTPMPVVQVVHAVAVKPDHVYVIPPGKHLAMTDGTLCLTDISQSAGRRVAVDLFFRTLAESHGPRAAAIVLSGADGDGALGTKRIKECGGLTIAQEPDEAQQWGMPKSAIATGTVDWVLPVAEMPGRLLQYVENARRLHLPAATGPLPAGDREMADEEAAADRGEAALAEVLAFLRMRTGHDFSYYKRATILRRIARRMQVNGCEDIATYLNHIRTHTGETGALLQDLLISVTNFFREPEAFACFEENLPRLFKGKKAADQVRVWVAACATGEEAYSIAMLLCEYASRLDSPPQIQVFATDIDQSAIDSARLGIYPESIAADVTEERLRRFFVKEAGTYRVRRSVREVVLFALHDVLKDSPFSRLDAVACRNLLIYLDRDAQARAFDLFHFALNQGGLLFLGSSESAEEAASLFIPVDKKHRVYARSAAPRLGVILHPGAPPLTLTMQALRRNGMPSYLPANAASQPGMGPSLPLPSRHPEPPRPPSMTELHFKMVGPLIPPSVVVNRAYDIIHLSDGASKFLQFATGEPSMNLLKTVHPALRIDLRTVLFRAGKSGVMEESPAIPMEVDGEPRLVDLMVAPAGEFAPELLLVLFRLHRETEPSSPAAAPSKEVAAVVEHLEEELDQTRIQWRESVEQYETSTEELKASNEELQAMNEELRSATEELETGREELQSINEELTTVNQELKGKVEELSRSNSDLQNLMASTNIATIFLDRELRIQRYTPSALALFNLIPTDLGRPLSDLTHQLDYQEIATDAMTVLTHLEPIQREVRAAGGLWFLARLLPYRTAENKVAGVVLTCVDITERKAGEDERRWLSSIVESTNDAVISFSLTGEIISWNQGAQRIFGYTAEEMKGKSQTLLAPPEYYDEKREILAKLQRGQTIESFETVRLRKDGTLIDVSLSVSVIRNERGELVGATAIAQDITARKQAVAELRVARDHLEERVEQRTEALKNQTAQLRRMASELTRGEQRERLRIARLLHDHVQQLVVAAKMRVEALRRTGVPEMKTELTRVITLLEETVESSRTLAVELSPPILHEGLAPALEWLGAVWMNDKHRLSVHMNLDHSVDAASDEMRSLVFLAVREILFNVVKHSGLAEANVSLERSEPATLTVTVKDGGKGFDLQDLQSDHPAGSGLGLFSLRERLEMSGGKLQLVTAPGSGVEAKIIVPRGPDKVAAEAALPAGS